MSYLLVDVGQFFLESPINPLTGIKPLVLLIHVVDDLDVSESLLVTIDLAAHLLVRPQVLLAELTQNLLMSFVRSNVTLESKDPVGKVAEQTIAKSHYFPQVEAQSFIKAFMLAP